MMDCFPLKWFLTFSAYFSVWGKALRFRIHFLLLPNKCIWVISSWGSGLRYIYKEAPWQESSILQSLQWANHPVIGGTAQQCMFLQRQTLVWHNHIKFVSIMQSFCKSNIKSWCRTFKNGCIISPTKEDLQNHCFARWHTNGRGPVKFLWLQRWSYGVRLFPVSVLNSKDC